MLARAAQHMLHVHGRMAPVGRWAVQGAGFERHRVVRRALGLRTPLPLPLARAPNAEPRAAPSRGGLGHRPLDDCRTRDGPKESVHHPLRKRRLSAERRALRTVLERSGARREAGDGYSASKMFQSRQTVYNPTLPHNHPIATP